MALCLKAIIALALEILSDKRAFKELISSHRSPSLRVGNSTITSLYWVWLRKFNHKRLFHYWTLSHCLAKLVSTRDYLDFCAFCFLTQKTGIGGGGGNCLGTNWKNIFLKKSLLL